MNENIDLTKILKGLEGIELWSPLYGECKLSKIYSDRSSPYPIEVVCKDINNDISYPIFTEDGKHFCKMRGECILFPSKDQRDWSKFQRPIPVDTPMMCSDNTINWHLRYYKGLIYRIHRVFIDGLKHNETDEYFGYTYMIPFDKFNPNDLEESLKYNIQK